ncbi:hypothetical protein ES703_55353 [subsurface metagenome]
MNVLHLIYSLPECPVLESDFLEKATMQED